MQLFQPNRQLSSTASVLTEWDIQGGPKKQATIQNRQLIKIKSNTILLCTQKSTRELANLVCHT